MRQPVWAGLGLVCMCTTFVPARAASADASAETLAAFHHFVAEREARAAERVQGRRDYLWISEDPRNMERVREGEAIAEPVSGRGILHVPDGLIHNWIGAVFIPGVTLDAVLSVLHDYNNHKYLFKPELIDSRLISRNGNEYRTYTRIIKKKLITLVFDAEYDVRYYELDPAHWYSRCTSTRINEVENYGKPGERELPDGAGMLRRLETISRFEERDGGVYIECEAISLSKPLPSGLGWLIEGAVRSISRSSMIRTLDTTRHAVLARERDVERASLQRPRTGNACATCSR